MAGTASASSPDAAPISNGKDVPVKTASSNWKALRKTMPISVAAQEMTTNSRKRKRQSFNADTFVNGSPVAESSASTPQNDKGKGKAKLLGEGDMDPAKAEVGQYVSLDCEFVGLYDPANDHPEHSLARVSMVNFHGAIVLDTFVAQRERVGDYRTWVSGVRPEDVQNAPTYEEVQKKVADILKGRVLVGHAVHNDLKVLLLSHPHNMTRDTQTYGPLRELAGSKRPSLKNLAKKALGIDIQEGEHSSVTDARATMAIYRTVQKQWESALRGGVHKAKKIKEKHVKGSSGAEGSSKGTEAQATRKDSGARVKGGPAAWKRNGILGLAATISREKDWWSSGTLDS